MADEQFKQLIQQVNAEQISDKANLWPGILKQIEASSESRKRRRLLPRTRTGWLIALVIALLTMGAAVAAVDQLLNLGGDAGLQAADQQGLITHLSLSQTQGDITVTLDYAYADSNRITVGYTLSALVKPDDALATGMNSIYSVDQLTDNQGHSFIGIAGGGGGGGGGDESEPTPTMVLISSSHETDYDVFESLGTPDSLNLALQVDIYKHTDPNTPMIADQDEKLAAFQFPFTIPFYPGLVMNDKQTASAAGMTMTLQRFVVTPSMTRAVICYDQPPVISDYNNWLPDLELHVGDKDILNDQYTSNNWILNSDTVGDTIPANCLIYALPQALPPEKGDWTVTVPDLYSPALGMDTFMAYQEGRLKQYGVQVVPQPEGGYTYQLPDGMDHSQLGDILQQITGETTIFIKGPWTFTFKMG